MNISLTPELEKFVIKEVKTGLYQSASEVIRAGLRRLREDKERKPGFMVSSAEELQGKLLEGVRSGPADVMARKDWRRLRNTLEDRIRSKHA